MEFSTLTNKLVVDNKIDLLSNFLEIDYDKIIIDEWILIDEQAAMLLDLISFSMYGSDNYVDILKKFNKIDNPLALQIGQIIAIPNITSFEQNSRLLSPTIKTIQRKKWSKQSTITSVPTKKVLMSSNFVKQSNGNLIF